MRVCFLLACAGWLVGCGGGGSNPIRDCTANGGADCFDMPTQAMYKRDTANPAVSANFNCAPAAITTAPGPVDVSGTVVDFQSRELLVGATLTAFALDDLTFASPLVSTTSDANGAFILALPTGVESRVNWRSQHASGLDTYALNSLIDTTQANVGVERAVVSTLTANAIPQLIGTERVAGAGVLAGDVFDCDGDEVRGAIATVSRTSGAGNTLPTFVPDAEVYYFQGTLPVDRGSTTETTARGTFVILNIPPGTSSYTQVWGFLNNDALAQGQAGLSLVSEFQGPVIADAVISIEMDPTEGPL